MIDDRFESVLAKDITDCEECPLFKYDCVGGWTSSGGGTPIEPPCTRWDANTEVYSGMYPPYEPSNREIEWARQDSIVREQEQKDKRDREYKNDLTARVHEISKYGNTKVQYGSGLRPKWYCPRCHNWFLPWFEGHNKGISSTECPYCDTKLAHSGEIECKY